MLQCAVDRAGRTAKSCAVGIDASQTRSLTSVANFETRKRAFPMDLNSQCSTFYSRIGNIDFKTRTTGDTIANTACTETSIGEREGEGGEQW